MEAVAGSGVTGPGRSGPALQSPLAYPDAVAALPAGGFAFSEAGIAVWAVDTSGQMRLLAGGGRGLKIPRAGRPALSVQLGEIHGIETLPDGEVVLLESDGAFTIAQGLISEFVHGPHLGFGPPAVLPLWGRRAGTTCVGRGERCGRSQRGRRVARLDRDRSRTDHGR